MGLFSSKSKMKQLGTYQGFTVHEMGDRLYLMLPTEPTDRVVVSAHGGYDKTSGSSRFEVPAGMTLNFYSQHGNTVQDPGLRNFVQKLDTAVAKETVRGGEHCYNYILSKYQGKSNNKMGETYESIARAVNDEVQHLRTLESQLEKAKASNNDRMAKSLGGVLGKKTISAIITVRNRFNRPDVNLKDVVAEVSACAPQLTYWDCLFCRSFTTGKSGSDAVVFT